MTTAAAQVRVLLVGCPGAGKSTLARRLGAVTGLPVRHLDDEYWGPNWTRRAPAEWVRRQAELVADDEWIIDGNYLPTMDVRVCRATLVVLVDAAAPVCALRVVRRALEVRCSRYDSLPRQVRGQALQGQPVAATKDFVKLLKQVLRFRRREWWPVVELVRAEETEFVVAVSGGLWGHAGRVRRRLARRGVAVPVIDATRVPDLIGPRLR